MNGESQDLWVSSVEDAEQVKIWLQEWQAGQLSAKPDAAEKTPWQVVLQQQLIDISQFPVTFMLAVTLLSIFILQQLGLIDISDWLLKPELWQQEKFDYSSFWLNDLYRWWSHALIHLSLLYLLMNGFWWWLLGRQVETLDGHITLIVITLILALTSGFAQYLAVGPYFAGLSGVTYGLMGWVWGRQTFKASHYDLPPWLFPFMMLSMLVMILIDSAGADLRIGHESHLAGAIIGVLLAFLWPKVSTEKVDTEQK
jgi:GlpG protein